MASPVFISAETIARVMDGSVDTWRRKMRGMRGYFKDGRYVRVSFEGFKDYVASHTHDGCAVLRDLNERIASAVRM